MKVNGRNFANHLIRRWNFRELRQTGSRIILRTEPSAVTVSVPAHKLLRQGTLRGLVDTISQHNRVPPIGVLSEL